MPAQYWIELSQPLADNPAVKRMLRDCGVEVVRTGPRTFLGDELRTVWWEISDPAADESLNGKTVILTFQEYVDQDASLLNLFGADEGLPNPLVYKTRIIERRAR